LRWRAWAIDRARRLDAWKLANRQRTHRHQALAIVRKFYPLFRGCVSIVIFWCSRLSVDGNCGANLAPLAVPMASRQMLSVCEHCLRGGGYDVT
jgi:hypothetical protein